MNLSGFGVFDYIYLILLLFFIVFFAIKGATRSIIYSLKIGLTISLPYYFHKNILLFSIEKLNKEILFKLYSENSIFFELISFTILFLVVYITLSILFKALDIKSPSQLEFKILDMLSGAMIGIVLYSILFYLLYATVLKNYINEKNRIMELNISIYDNINIKDVEEEKEIIKDSSSKEKKNEKDKLY